MTHSLFCRTVFLFMSSVCSLWVRSEMMSKLSPLHDKSTKCEQCMNQIWTVMIVHNGAVVHSVFLSRFWGVRQLHMWDYMTSCGIAKLWLIWRLSLIWYDSNKQCLFRIEIWHGIRHESFIPFLFKAESTEFRQFPQVQWNFLTMI